MELPIYHIPAWKNVIIHAWDRCKAFVQKAGTVIFVSSALIWFLSSYNWKVDSVEQNDSMLASIGNVAAPVFQPLGWGEWNPPCYHYRIDCQGKRGRHLRRPVCGRQFRGR